MRPKSKPRNRDRFNFRLACRIPVSQCSHFCMYGIERRILLILSREFLLVSRSNHNPDCKAAYRRKCSLGGLQCPPADRYIRRTLLFLRGKSKPINVSHVSSYFMPSSRGKQTRSRLKTLKSLQVRTEARLPDMPLL